MDPAIEFMKKHRMLRYPCEALLPCTRLDDDMKELLRVSNKLQIAQGALEHAEGVAMSAMDRAVLEVLVAMRPWVTVMLRQRMKGSAPAPSAATGLCSAEVVQYEVALLHAQMRQLPDDFRSYTYFRAMGAELPGWLALEDTDLHHWEDLATLMHERLAQYLELRDDYARAASNWHRVGQKRRTCSASI